MVSSVELDFSFVYYRGRMQIRTRKVLLMYNVLVEVYRQYADLWSILGVWGRYWLFGGNVLCLRPLCAVVC